MKTKLSVKTKQFPIKICTKCGNEAEHYLTKHCGKPRTSAFCIKCSREDARNRRREFRKQLVNLFNHRCGRCGLVDSVCIYEFHHKYDKKINLNQAYDMQKISEELKKCEMLCTFCHRKEHYYDQPLRITIPQNAVNKICEICRKKNPHQLRKKDGALGNSLERTRKAELYKKQVEDKWELGKKMCVVIEDMECKNAKYEEKHNYCTKNYGISYTSACDYIKLYKNYTKDSLPMFLSAMRVKSTNKFDANSTHYVSNLCCYCEAIRENKNIREMRNKAVKMLGGICKICGFTGDAYLFDFHHNDPLAKEFKIASRCNLSKIKEEIKKCSLLCAHCHKKLHFNSFDRISQ